MKTLWMLHDLLNDDNDNWVFSKILDCKPPQDFEINTLTSKQSDAANSTIEINECLKS